LFVVDIGMWFGGERLNWPYQTKEGQLGAVDLPMLPASMMLH